MVSATGARLATRSSILAPSSILFRNVAQLNSLLRPQTLQFQMFLHPTRHLWTASRSLRAFMKL
jgi:hypothetical protein